MQQPQQGASSQRPFAFRTNVPPDVLKVTVGVWQLVCETIQRDAVRVRTPAPLATDLRQTEQVAMYLLVIVFLRL